MLSWFEQESFEFTLEEISEIHTLPIVYKMRNVITLLSCQPENRKNKMDDTTTFTGSNGSNLMESPMASSASAISQVSIGKFCCMTLN